MARSARLTALEAREALRYTDLGVDEALAFEEDFGGFVLRAMAQPTAPTWELGLATHRAHPPRDAYDEWLDRALQRRMIQVAFGGRDNATGWLDARGWVHEIGPLDRLRPCAPSLADFIAGVLDDALPVQHHACVALSPLDADDADALFSSAAVCPVDARVARWSDEALEVLEEQAWVERWRCGPVVVISAPSLTWLAEPLAALTKLAPEVEVALLEGDPRPAREPLAEVVVTREFVQLHTDVRARVALGREADGRWSCARA